LKVFLITADGHPTDNPRSYRTAERALRTTQRRVARRTQGSRRRRKAIALLKRTHQKVQRQRSYFHHKTALDLLRAFDTIYLEDLQVRNLVRNHHLAKSISDAAWRQFRTLLDAKAACAGRQVIAVPAGVHHPGLQWGAARWEPLQTAGSQEPVGAHPTYPCLPVLWASARP
jgi:putative transposase